MEAGKTKQDLARWQKLTMKDLMCLHYWVNIGLTIALVFNLSDSLAEYTSTPTRKLSSLIILWIASIAFYQTILGTSGLLKSALIFAKSPFSILKISYGFLRDSYKSLKRMIENLPYRLLFLTSLILTPTLGFTEDNFYFLSLLFYLIPIQAIFLIRFIWLWTLNPISFLNRFKDIATAASLTKIVSGLASFDKDKGVNSKTILEKFDLFKKIINGIEGLATMLSHPALSLRLFVGMIFSVGTYIIVSSAVFLRIINRIFSEDSIIFENSLFQKSDILSYLYVSSNSFIGADLHGVTINSPYILFVLTFLPYAALFLLGVVILAYSTVTQSNVSDKFSSITKGVVDIVAQAIEKVQKDTNIIEIESNNKAEEITPATNDVIQ